MEATCDPRSSGTETGDSNQQSRLYPTLPADSCCHHSGSTLDDVSYNERSTDMTTEDSSEDSSDKYDLNAKLMGNYKEHGRMVDDDQCALSTTQHNSEGTQSKETDKLPRNTSNKDRRKNIRLQSGAMGNKYQDAHRFPGGHNKANESRDKPTAVVNPLSGDGGEKRATGNQQQTEGCKNRDRSSFVAKETDNYVFFWRKGSPFSQWHPAEFTVDREKFNCAEQYMMYNKARFANCEALMIAILNESDPEIQKSYGRKVPNLNFDDWALESPKIVKTGNYAKFSQNEELKQKLLSTYPKKLVEASPHDQIWGIGLHADDPRALNESEWRGSNLLGKILTEVRDELLRETGFI